MINSTLCSSFQWWGKFEYTCCDSTQHSGQKLDSRPCLAFCPALLYGGENAFFIAIQGFPYQWHQQRCSIYCSCCYQVFVLYMMWWKSPTVNSGLSREAEWRCQVAWNSASTFKQISFNYIIKLLRIYLFLSKFPCLKILRMQQQWSTQVMVCSTARLVGQASQSPL